MVVDVPPTTSFPVPEISFRSYHRYEDDDDDNKTLPSELSSLIPLSTLTPNHNPHLRHHLQNPSGSSTAFDQASMSSRRAFRLAALLAILSFAVLACVDVIYVVNLTSSQSETDVSALQVERSVEVDGETKKPKSDKKKKKQQQQQKQQPEEEADDNQENKDIDDQRETFATDKMMNVAPDDDKTNPAQDDDDKLNFARDDTSQVAVPNSGLADSSSSGGQKSGEVKIPTPEKRCSYVVNTFETQNEGFDKDFLSDKYKAQSGDPNLFYRSTALIFWQDFAAGMWGKDQNKSIVLDDLVLLSDATYEDGTPMSPYSTWTWVTGDQHLSNFGAWRNRAKEVVYSVNDFDEAAIFDFHIDVLRIAVSIADHGLTNGLSLEQVKGTLEAFTYTYVKTVIDYVGNDKALIYELNAQTSTGVLRDFLADVENKRSKAAQMEKFTDQTDTGRRFTRDKTTRLVDVPSEIDDKIRAAFTKTKYGSSMMKMGWKVRGWDDDFFTIIDIARRVGSGMGSYGVDRFYVLLKGKDELLEEGEDSHVILDVKYEPKSAVSRTLDEVTRSWYNAMFQSEADRVAQAQVALTSYTDPYVGYIYIDGDSYNVRQRSPYKDSFDIVSIKDHRVFDEYVEQIAISTATAHVRGTVAKSPGQFKHNIKRLLAGDRNRSRWSSVSATSCVSFFSFVNQLT